MSGLSGQWYLFFSSLYVMFLYAYSHLCISSAPMGSYFCHVHAGSDICVICQELSGDDPPAMWNNSDSMCGNVRYRIIFKSWYVLFNPANIVLWLWCFHLSLCGNRIMWAGWSHRTRVWRLPCSSLSCVQSFSHLNILLHYYCCHGMYMTTDGIVVLGLGWCCARGREGKFMAAIIIIHHEYDNSAICNDWTQGLVLLLSCIPCIFMDVLLLKERIYVFISNRARKTGIQVHVETQTRLLAAGDTPTVTPGTLQDMVSELLFVCDDPSCHVTANKCRFVLKERGYELPLNRNIADSLTAMNTIRARDDKNRRNSSNNWTSIPPHSQSTDCIPKNVCAESKHELHLHNMKQKSHHAQSPSPEDPEALYLEATVATGTCTPKYDRHD